MGNNTHEIYHSDHLGSSSYITDNFGRPSHYYEYLPFGELMTEHNQSKYYLEPYPTQNMDSYNNPYKFNDFGGKNERALPERTARSAEMDRETGMYYYGARYYDPRISIFVSVDPLAEQTMEPYLYTGNNPIMFTDPTGMASEHIGFGKNEVANRKLTDKEKASLLSSLQSITDDKLVYNSKTNRIEISKMGTGKKKEGTDLIRRLISHDKELTVSLNRDGKYGMIGAATSTTNGDRVNSRNGKGTNTTINIGIGHEIYTQDSKGKIYTEMLSDADMLDHELVHALGYMNGEARDGGDSSTPIYYKDTQGISQQERVSKEEYLTIFGTKNSKKIKGYQYPSENILRNEQGKNKRINYLKTKQIGR